MSLLEYPKQMVGMNQVIAPTVADFAIETAATATAATASDVTATDATVDPASSLSPDSPIEQFFAALVDCFAPEAYNQLHLAALVPLN
jgi:hypothetical protein